MKEINFKRATAVYSGGGIYLYYAELDNGQWVMGSDEGLLIVNANPLKDDETFYNSDYEEWQSEHLVKYIDFEDTHEYLIPLVETIKQGKTIKEYDNFILDELIQRANGRGRVMIELNGVEIHENDSQFNQFADTVDLLDFIYENELKVSYIDNDLIHEFIHELNDWKDIYNRFHDFDYEEIVWLENLIKQFKNL